MVDPGYNCKYTFSKQLHLAKTLNISIIIANVSANFFNPNQSNGKYTPNTFWFVGGLFRNAFSSRG